LKTNAVKISHVVYLSKLTLTKMGFTLPPGVNSLCFCSKQTKSHLTVPLQY